MWILGHRSIPGNESADLLAKESLHFPDPSPSHVKCPTESISRTSTNWTKKSYMILQAITATKR